MDFALTEEQQAIFDMARDFGAEHIAPHSREWEAAGTIPKDLWPRVAALGFGGLYVSEEYGGSGLTRLDATLVFEALAMACPAVGSFLSIHNMCTWMVDTYGSEEQRQEWIPKLAPMDVMASYCLTEPGAGSDAASLTTRAERDGDDFVLNGTKQFISGGGASDLYVVMARSEGEGARGISTFLVDKGTEGLSFGPPEVKMGWHSQPTTQVIFENVRIPASRMLGGTDGAGKGFGIAMNGLNGGRLNIAACSLGGAQAAYDLALRYMTERETFGRKLIDEPTIRFALADMATSLEASRLILWRAATALDENDPDKVELCAMAKKFVTETCFQVADQALQLHGGYGYLHETGVEKIVRDLRVNRILEGTNEIMRMVIGRAEAARIQGK